MFPPNVLCSYLLKRWYLEDTRRAHLTPQEPIARVVKSSPRLGKPASKSRESIKPRIVPPTTKSGEALSWPLVWYQLEDSRLAAMPQTTGSARGIRKPRPQAAEYPWRAASDSEGSCLKSRKLTEVLLRNPTGSLLHRFYFAPRCHNTTFAVSKRMARSNVRERCLM